MIYAVNKRTKEHKLMKHRDYGPGRSVDAWKYVECDADGWIKHDGRRCPLPRNTRNQVKFRDGAVSLIDDEPQGWSWTHDGDDGNVIAYRPIIDTKPEPPAWDGEGLPPAGCECEHYSGRIYRVTGYANENTERPEQYPVTIIYQNVDNGTVWARPADEWSRSFRPIRSEEDRAVDALSKAMKKASEDGIDILEDKACCRVVYQAIRDGKVPGVKLTGGE